MNHILLKGTNNKNICVYAYGDNYNITYVNYILLTNKRKTRYYKTIYEMIVVLEGQL